MRLSVILVLCLVATTALAKGKSKRMDRERRKRLDNSILNAKEGGLDIIDEEYEEVQVKRKQEEHEEFKHPCNRQKCRRGEVCSMKEDKAVCVCQTCENEEESVVKVCSTKNVTYDTECQLDRDHCLCKHRLEGCSDSSEHKVRLDYFAACKQLTKCPEKELEDFPGRMRDWLFRIMRELAMRAEIDEYRDMLESARHDEFHADAVIWKFCDLDADPEDRRITRRELMYIIASLKPMEHCLVPFLLNKCDANDDNGITLEEWGACLGLADGHLQEKCHPVHTRRG